MPFSMSNTLIKQCSLSEFRYVAGVLLISVWSICLLGHLNNVIRWFLGASFLFVFIPYSVITTSNFWFRKLSGKQLELEKEVKEEDLPFIDLIIPAKDEAKVLPRLIQSVQDTSYPKEKLHMIIVNDASTDETKEILEAYEKNIEWLDVIHVDKPTGGKSGAMNVGYPYIRKNAEIIGYFDGDCVIQDKDCLKKTAAMFSSDQKIGAVQIPKSINPSFCKGPLEKLQFWEMLADLEFQQCKFAVSGIPDLHGDGEFVRKQILESFGGKSAWNENSVTDDLDMTIRIALYGFRTAVLENWFSILEEPVYTWNSMFKQRRRWATGGYQRFLDYYKYLISWDWEKTDSFFPWAKWDMICTFGFQYIFPNWMIADYVLTYLLSSTPVGKPMEYLMIVWSLSIMFLNCYQVYNSKLYKHSYIWMVLFPIFGSMFLFIVGFVTVDSFLNPRRLAYSKSERLDSKSKLSNAKEKKEDASSIQTGAGAILLIFTIIFWFALWEKDYNLTKLLY